MNANDATIIITTTTNDQTINSTSNDENDNNNDIDNYDDDTTMKETTGSVSDIVQDNNDNNDDDNNNNNDIDCQNTNTNTSRKNYFSLIQQPRRFGYPLCDTTITLCPSMDLVIYGISSSSTGSTSTSTQSTATTKSQQQLEKNYVITTTNSNSNTSTSANKNSNNNNNNCASILHIHRTVNWEKLVSIPSGTVTTISSSTNTYSNSNNNDKKQSSLLSSSSTTTTTTTTSTGTSSSRTGYQYTHVTWRPDGRFVAIADSIGRISIYNIEGMLNNGSNGEGGSNNSTSSSSSSSTNINTNTELFISNNSTSTIVIDDDDIDIPGKVYTIPSSSLLLSNSSISITGSSTLTTQISAVAWHHIGKIHPIWKQNKYNNNYNDDKNAADTMWTYRTQLIDREQYILPSSVYHNQCDLLSMVSDTNTNTTTNNTPSLLSTYTSPFPTSDTPLSILYAIMTTTTTTTTNTTTQQHAQVNDNKIDNTTSNYYYLNAYIHGRYPILLQQPIFTNNRNNKSTADNLPTTLSSFMITTSADMAHTIIAPTGNKVDSNSIMICSIPSIIKNKYTYQQITMLYSKITCHIQTIQCNINYILSSYQSSLKLIDLKLDTLYKLLENYGLIPKLTSTTTDDDIEDDDDDDDDHIETKRKNTSDIIDTNSGTSTINTKATTTINTTNRLSTIRPLLVQYILSGHTRTSPNLSNAIDQFFTGIQMNDQLLVRMERSLVAAICNVEKLCKQLLLAPVIALHYSCTLLHGLIQYRSDMFQQHDTTSTKTIQLQNHLLTRTELVVVSIESTVTEIIKSRGRIRDFVSWLRSTGAQIKARGTAPKSVQHDNARKRRVPDSLIRRMLSYLRTSTENNNCDNDSNIESAKTTLSSSSTNASAPSATEILLDLKVSMLLSTSMDFVSFDDSIYGTDRTALNPLSPSANCDGISSNNSNNFISSSSSLLVGDDSIPIKKGGRYSNATTKIRVTSTVPFALSKLIESLQEIFVFPRQYISKGTITTRIGLKRSEFNDNDGRKTDDMSLSNTSSRRCVAIVTRLGQGGTSMASYYGEPKLGGYFLPSATTTTTTSEHHMSVDDEDSLPCSSSFRQWSVIANVSEPNQIQLHALPLTWTTTSDHEELDEMYDDDNDDENDANTKHNNPVLAVPFQWSCQLSFPNNTTIEDVVFYSDDGKSSLLSSSSPTAGLDSSSAGGVSGEEGKQSLGVILRRKHENPATDSDLSSSSTVEIWLIKYDKLPYSQIPVTVSSPTTINKTTSLDDIDQINNDDDNSTFNIDLSIGSISTQPVSSVQVQAFTEDDDDENDDDVDEVTTANDGDEKNNYNNSSNITPITIIKAKTRVITSLATTATTTSENNDHCKYRFVVSGSRGIGAVYVTDTTNGTTLMELLDLEENEDVVVEDNDDDAAANEDEAKKQRGDMT